MGEQWLEWLQIVKSQYSFFRFICRSEHSHVHHVTPSLVVSVWGVWVLVIVRCLYSELDIIWMVTEELDFSLESCKVLTVHLIGEMPEGSFPNQVSLTILKPHNVLIISSLGDNGLMECRTVEPKADHGNTAEQGPALEPSFGINVIKGPIGVSLEWSRNWESVRSILFREHTERIHHIWYFLGHPSQDVLLSVPEFNIKDSLLQSKHLIVVLTC